MEIEQLRKMRKQKRITIIELASKMGVSQAYISKLELGQVHATKEQVEVIKEFLAGKL